MIRYNPPNIFKRFDGKRAYLTTQYPTIPVGSSDIFISTNETTKLDSLAQKYYSDSTLWWIIARANSLGKGTLEVPEGTLLRIPQNVFSIVQEFNTLNS
jgi:hypothetical protein